MGATSTCPALPVQGQDALLHCLRLRVVTNNLPVSGYTLAKLSL